MMAADVKKQPSMMMQILPLHRKGTLCSVFFPIFDMTVFLKPLLALSLDGHTSPCLAPEAPDCGRGGGPGK